MFHFPFGHIVLLNRTVLPLVKHRRQHRTGPTSARDNFRVQLSRVWEERGGGTRGEKSTHIEFELPSPFKVINLSTCHGVQQQVYMFKRLHQFGPNNL